MMFIRYHTYSSEDYELVNIGEAIRREFNYEPGGYNNRFEDRLNTLIKFVALLACGMPERQVEILAQSIGYIRAVEPAKSGELPAADAVKPASHTSEE